MTSNELERIQKLYETLKPLVNDFRTFDEKIDRNAQILLDDLGTLLEHSDISQPLKTQSLRKKIGPVIDAARLSIMKIFHPLTKILLVRQIRFNQLSAHLWFRVVSLEKRIMLLEETLVKNETQKN